jgi:16S rRNA (cytidine1402-2'-O)-methyltransferase
MLYFIPTPIGNLQDMTIRSLNILQTVEIILTEDSRQSHKLLNLLKTNLNENLPENLQIEFRTRENLKFVDLNRHHKFNFYEVNKVLDRVLTENIDVAVMTDSGMPAISDPGYEVVQLCVEKNISYTVLPGASSLITAVAASGLIYKEFIFLGFLPIKKGRQKAWKNIVSLDKPVVLFESTHRMEKFLYEAKTYLHPEAKICICKDLSKLYEKIVVSKVCDLDNLDLVIKGEFVIVIQHHLAVDSL